VSLPKKQPAIALITNDVVGERMAGPGIRYWEFARLLGQRFPVKLLVPPYLAAESASLAQLPAVDLHVCAGVQELRELAAACDVVVTLGANLLRYPFLLELDQPLVLDLYSPFLLEDLHREAGSDFLKQLTGYENSLAKLILQLRAGDFFLCASEKQRDYWLGLLSAVGRINPYTYRQDPTLRRLIDVVPFGLPAAPPRQTRPVLKGVYKTIAAEDKVILWGGGIWSWLDAATLVRAMPLVLQEQTGVKLFFMGIRRPNQTVQRMAAVDEAIRLSQELGLYEQAIFFNDWVPYDERQNYLLEADIGVSLHLDHVETRFSFRTRLLDYVWAGLPTVATRGDVLGETLAAQGLAHLVEPGDVKGVARAILELLDRPGLRAGAAGAFQQLAAQYRWNVVAQPLLDFCAAPSPAPDKAYLRQQTRVSRSSAWRLLVRSWRALRFAGPAGLLRQSSEYLRWKLGGR
jgi:glycosyltransferase involved in cell wall biosynthesis